MIFRQCGFGSAAGQVDEVQAGADGCAEQANDEPWPEIAIPGLFVSFGHQGVGPRKRLSSVTETDSSSIAVTLKVMFMMP